MGYLAAESLKPAEFLRWELENLSGSTVAGSLGVTSRAIGQFGDPVLARQAACCTVRQENP